MALLSPTRRLRPTRDAGGRPVVRPLGSERRIAAILAVYLVVIGAIIVSNARATSAERDAALVVNVAARQRAFAERYVKDVVLRLDGYQAAPEEDAHDLQVNARALLSGGVVEAVQGADGTVRIPPPGRDTKVIAKLRQEQRLIERLVAVGRDLLRTGSVAPGGLDRILRLRIVGAQVGTITNDAVGQMTKDVDAHMGRLVGVGIGFGVLATVAAVAMGLLVRRASRQRAEQFRALIHQSSDLTTVVGRDSTVSYASGSAERVLGYPPQRLVGTRLWELVHPDDLPGLTEGFDRLMASPLSTAHLEHRLRHADGTWRHVETSASNRLDDPLVRGVVLNTRDVTRRVLADQGLKRLQHEQEGLLERTVQATEQERRRVAAELHDGPVQHLTTLDVALERARLALDPEEAKRQVEAIGRVQDRLRQEVGELRKMMTELRPPVLDNLGISAALQDHVTSVGREAGLDCRVEATFSGRLLPSQEIVLYRVAQEALTNVVKHAGASRVWVSLQPQNGNVVLEIRDDGAGFDPAAGADEVAGHFGLLGMRERVEMVGGRWELRSGVGEGTLVRASLPRSEGA
jgi:PAS domain S-box-containing protein